MNKAKNWLGICFKSIDFTLPFYLANEGFTVAMARGATAADIGVGSYTNWDAADWNQVTHFTSHSSTNRATDLMSKGSAENKFSSKICFPNYRKWLSAIDAELICGGQLLSLGALSLVVGLVLIFY